jgi:hypothetical protein
MSKELTNEEMKKQNEGWWSMVFFLILFPVVFFLCVFFPIWMGWTPAFP